MQLEKKAYRLKRILTILSILLVLLSCSSPYKAPTSRSKRTSAPSGKYRSSTIFSRVNPFQGRAKAKLAKSKRKKLRLFKKKKHSGKARRGKKPGRTFNMKRKVSRGRIKSSGSRAKGGSGRSSGRKKKNLFNTRKK
ncbi:MAG: hypothetical protein CMP59_12390 [Flavobacteriales bacterium]|nr:hypothetical protein [Flavobacteriales bacterium]